MENIKKIIYKYKSVISYLIFGVLTTLVNIIVFGILYTKYHLMGVQSSNFIAWFLSVLFAYVTNKLYVFNSHPENFKGQVKEISSFFMFRILSYAMDAGMMFLGITVWHQNSLIVKIVDNFVVVVANYIFSKVFIFTSKSESN